MTTGSRVERIAAALGPTRRRPAKNRATAPTVEMTRDAGQPAEPGALTAAGSRSPMTRPARVSLIGGAGAHERRQGERPDARGDALRGEDVDGVHAGGAAGRARCPTGSSAPAAAPASMSTSPVAGQHQRDGDAGAELVAAEPIAATVTMTGNV